MDLQDPEVRKSILKELATGEAYAVPGCPRIGFPLICDSEGTILENICYFRMKRRLATKSKWFKFKVLILTWLHVFKLAYIFCRNFTRNDFYNYTDRGSSAKMWEGIWKAALVELQNRWKFQKLSGWLDNSFLIQDLNSRRGGFVFEILRQNLSQSDTFLQWKTTLSNPFPFLIYPWETIN